MKKNLMLRTEENFIVDEDFPYQCKMYFFHVVRVYSLMAENIEEFNSTSLLFIVYKECFQYWPYPCRVYIYCKVNYIYIYRYMTE